jgi:hypothetical protein
VSDNLGFGLSGSVVAELAMRGKVEVSENHRLGLKDNSQTDDGLLNEALVQIQSSTQPRKVTYWIKQFSDEPKKLQQRLIERLEADRIVNQDGNRLTWVIPYSATPEINASAKYMLKTRLRKSVLAEEEPEGHDLALLGLVKACNLLNLVFTKDERKMARRRIYELTAGKTLKEPQFQSIREIEAAVEAQAEAD